MSSDAWHIQSGQDKYITHKVCTKLLIWQILSPLQNIITFTNVHITLSQISLFIIHGAGKRFQDVFTISTGDLSYAPSLTFLFFLFYFLFLICIHTRTYTHSHPVFLSEKIHFFTPTPLEEETAFFFNFPPFKKKKN